MAQAGGSSRPASQVKTEELGATIKELNEARDQHASLLQSASKDEDYGRLASLQSRVASLAAKETRLRQEVAAALEAEGAAELQARWDRAQELGDALIAAAHKVDVAAVAMAEALSGPMEGLKAAQIAFQKALPGSYGNGSFSKIASDGIALALDAIKVRVQNDDYRLKRMLSLEARAKDEVWERTLGNPSQPTERLKPPPLDIQGRRTNEFNQIMEE
jgi:hypothetical protein